jgi:uroporphyrinogen-III decarboxylase
MIRAAVQQSFAEAGGRCIVSAGCEVPRDTPLENMDAFLDAAESLCC